MMEAGITFSPISPPPAGMVTAQQAIAGAERKFGGSYPEGAATAEFGLVSNDTMYSTDTATGERTYVAQHRPAWLVTLNGREMASRNPHSKAAAHHELVVAMDGKTGRYLFAYSTR